MSEVSQMDPALVDAVEKFKALKIKKDELKEAEKAVEVELDLANKALLGVMDAMNLRNFDMGDKKYYVNTMTNAKIVEGQQEAFVQWMKGDAEGVGIVKETVHPKSASSFLAERLANGGPLPPTTIVEDPMAWSKRMVTMQSLKEKA